MRMRFDIGWRDILSTMADRSSCGDYAGTEADALRTWSAEDAWLVTLSVRSAFDLVLRALALPPGSEILMSPITVPDMSRIVRAHGLVPVAVDLDRTGQLCLESLRAAISKRTRILLAAHLFGGQLQLDGAAQICEQHGVLLFEDCAQSFTNLGAPGHPLSDAIMYSFGPIKTATAMGGGVVGVKSAELRQRMHAILQDDPIQAPSRWRKRLLKFSLLKLLCNRGLSSLVHSTLRGMGRDCDAFLNRLGRGFASPDIVTQIRYRPHPQLLRLLTRRWQSYDFGRIGRRRALGRRLDELLQITHETDHSFWTYRLRVSEPAVLAAQLRNHGYDATHQTRLVVLESPPGRAQPLQAQGLFASSCFLPWYPELTDRAVGEMARLVQRQTNGILEM